MHTVFDTYSISCFVTIHIIQPVLSNLRIKYGDSYFSYNSTKSTNVKFHLDQLKLLKIIKISVGRISYGINKTDE